MKTQEEEKKSIFKNDAKMIVDSIFDSKLFRDDLTRDDMTAIEESITICMDSKFDSHVKLAQLCERIEKSKSKKEES